MKYKRYAGHRKKVGRDFAGLPPNPGFFLLLPFLVLSGLQMPGRAATLNVPADYKTIQAALDAAADGDEIIVQPGRYIERIHFQGKNIALRSVDPDDLATIEGTIIDGNQSGTVVTFAGTETESCLLTGFTISNGFADFGGGINGKNGLGFGPGTSTRATILKNIVRDNTSGGITGCAGLLAENIVRGNESEVYEECIWHDLGGGDGYWECYNVGGLGAGFFRCDGIIENGGIQLPQVTPRCSMSTYGRLPKDVGRIHRAFLYGARVPCVSYTVAMAGGDGVFALRERHHVGDRPGPVRMRLVRPQPICNCGNALRTHTEALDPVVSGDVVRDQSEKGRQRVGTATGLGIGQLLHGVDVAAQTEARDGPARPGSPFGCGGGG